MDVREAREHIEMVDRILSQAEQRQLKPWSSLLFLFGIGAAFADTAVQWAADGRGNAAVAGIAGGLFLAAGFVYAIVASIMVRRRMGCLSAAEAVKGRTIGAVWLCIMASSFAAPHVLNGWSAAAIWSIGAAIQMAIFGFAGDRRALTACIALLASIVGANYAPSITGYVLAAGFVVGYIVPGILYATERASG